MDRLVARISGIDVIHGNKIRFRVKRRENNQRQTLISMSCDKTMQNLRLLLIIRKEFYDNNDIKPKKDFDTLYSIVEWGNMDPEAIQRRLFTELDVMAATFDNIKEEFDTISNDNLNGSDTRASDTSDESDNKSDNGNSSNNSNDSNEDNNNNTVLKIKIPVCLRANIAYQRIMIEENTLKNTNDDYNAVVMTSLRAVGDSSNYVIPLPKAKIYCIRTILQDFGDWIKIKCNNDIREFDIKHDILVHPNGLIGCNNKNKNENNNSNDDFTDLSALPTAYRIERERLMNEYDEFEDVVKALKIMFNNLIFRQLLFKEEKPQALKLQNRYNLKNYGCKLISENNEFKNDNDTKDCTTNDDLEPIDIYGAEHLVRLLLKLPTIYGFFSPQCTKNMKQRTAMVCETLSKYLEKYQNQYFQYCNTCNANEYAKLEQIDTDYLAKIGKIKLMDCI